ncbi:MAG: PQQ-binding-like beta-propeller repeat protein [Bacteroidales bacterium]|nr:PQQ-binding-like beta-propeller repeat protein [Bacteroidales bacterium]
MKRIHINLIIMAMILISGNSCTNQQSKSNQNEGQNAQNEASIGQAADEVYEWRGIQRKGIYYDKDLLKSWPEAGPALVWEYEGIGNGYGSPVFAPDKMYILGEIDSLAYLFTFDNNGTLLWKKPFGKEWVKNYNGSRSTPTVVNDLIYVTSGLGRLACLNRYDGEEIWKIDMIEDLHGTYPLFGFSESVIIEDDLVFCTPGGQDTNVVALNRFSGAIEWISKGAGERPGYNAPQIIHLNNRNILVNFTAYEMMGHDTKTGVLLWMHKQDNVKPEERKPGMGDTHSNTIIFEDGYIYYAEGDGNGGVKLKVSEDGKSIEEIWRNSSFDSYMGGIVKIGNHLYGSGTAKKDFKSINATSGEIEKILKIGSGAVIAADGMLYYYNFGGEVMLITQDPTDMQITGKFRIKKGENEHFAHPVINNGKLYVRHGNVLQAFNIKNKQTV